MRFRWLSAWTSAVLVVSLAAATEPDGRLALRTEWVSGAGAAGYPLRSGERLLRLGLSPSVRLADGRLWFRFPEGIRLRVLSVPRDAAPVDGLEREPRAWRMPDLRPGEPREIWLAVEVDAGSGGILAFLVEGRREDGRPFREAIGVSVGAAGGAGRSRAGAIEFPAHVLDADGDR